MADSYESFRSRVRNIGLPSGSHYQVSIMNAAVPDIMMMANSCSIPGMNIMTAQNRIWGETLETPYGITYDPATLTFILDNHMAAKIFFDSWANKVFDRNSRTLGYYDDYKRNVNIQLQDKMGKTIYDVTLVDAYPKQVNEIQLSFDNKETMVMTVQLQFKYWVRDYNNSGTVDMGQVNQSISDRLINPLGNITNSANMSVPVSSPLGSVQVPYDFDARNIGASLDSFGQSCGRSMGVAAGQAGKVAGSSPISGASSLLSSFTDLSNNFVGFGQGITSIGRNLGAVVAPVGQLAGSINSISGTLGTIDNTLSALGLGKPFAQTRIDLNGNAAKLGAVAGLKGLPGNLSSIGVSFSGMGNQFQQVSKSLGTVPGATSKLKNSISNLGQIVTKNGGDIGNSSAALQQSIDEEESGT